MKKRRIPGVERLEARETPDVSLGPTAYPLTSMSAKLAVAGGTRDAPTQALLAREASAQAGTLSGAAALLTEPGSSSNNARFSQAVRTLFANTAEVDRLLASSATLLPESPPARASVHAPAAQPAEAQGVQFLTNYTRKAIRNTEMKYGPLRDHEDIVHDVFVDWRARVGGGAKVFANVLNRDSAERQVLKKAVQRVIDHARYEQGRQSRMVELQDQPAPANPDAQEWIDLQIDWSLGTGAPGPRERRMLELRRQGKSFEEIGSEMGMLKQRVCEAVNATLDRLNETYSRPQDRQRHKKSPSA